MLNRKISILQIEDDLIDTMEMDRAAEKIQVPCEIYHAKNGAEALTMLRSQITPPHFIFLDINLPQMNGFEFLQALRADERLSKAVVFILSTSNREQDIALAYQYHVAGYINKDQLENGFADVITMLNAYFSVVSFPNQEPISC